MASYWISKQDPNGNVEAYMWDCHQCPVMGIGFTEAQTVEAMNSHMANKHADIDYSAPPVPNSE